MYALIRYGVCYIEHNNWYYISTFHDNRQKFLYEIKKFIIPKLSHLLMCACGSWDPLWYKNESLRIPGIKKLLLCRNKISSKKVNVQ